jgi:hypothetical protein
VKPVTLRLNGLTAVLAAGAILGGSAPSAAAPTTIPARWKNCTHVNAKYRHGVGKVGAHDKTSGTPVTNFTRSNCDAVQPGA